MPWGMRESCLVLLLGVGTLSGLNLLAVLTANGSTEGGGEISLGAFLFATLIGLALEAFPLAVTLIYSTDRYRLPLTALGLRRPRLRILWAVPVALAACLAASAAWSTLDRPPGTEPEPFPRTATGLVLAIVLTVIVAPLMEELVFRGFLFPAFIDAWGLWQAIAASALVFSLAHVNLYGFVPLFVVGAALAWVCHTTRSLWGSIALHAAWNLLATLAFALS